MKTYKQKAEAYVRQQLPELMEIGVGFMFTQHEYFKNGKIKVPHFCTIVGGNKYGWEYTFSGEVEMSYDYESAWTTKITEEEIKQEQKIGHPIQLQHWLRVLGGSNIDTVTVGEENVDVMTYTYDSPADYAVRIHIYFDLTTGQPATEADYQAFLDIVGI